MCRNTVREVTTRVKPWVWIAWVSCVALQPTSASAQHVRAISQIAHAPSTPTLYGATSTRPAQARLHAPTEARIGLRFPYADGLPGVRVPISRLSPRERTPLFVGVVDASAAHVIDGIVSGQLSARLRIGGIVGFEARYGAYFEQTAGALDALGIARLALDVTLVGTDGFEMRTGAAILVYHDEAGVEPGYAGSLEMDGYPVAPLVVHADTSFGQLGGAYFVDGRATLGAQIDRGEIYVGYQVLVVGRGAQSDVLHGPIVGVRIWIS